MARIVLTTVGSLGDLHPFIPVAGELRSRGHSVVFVVPDTLRPTLVAEGFTIHTELLPRQPLAPADWTASSTSEARSSVARDYGPYLRRCVEILTGAAQAADLLVAAPSLIAAAIVSERTKTPWITLTAYPGFIPSAYTVPQPHWLPALPTVAGRAINRATWSIYRYGLRYLASDTVDEVVGQFGLEVDRDTFGPAVISPLLTLVVSSPAYSPRPPDWPKQVKVVGFADWDRPRPWREPPELRGFLEAAPPPVVVTASSTTNSVTFLDQARVALEESGRRGVILTARASASLLGDRPHVVLDSGVSIWRYVPLSVVLPHASLVVHHAGIGTAIPVIRHGLPAVAVPSMSDQWYNASRIRALGVGVVVTQLERLAEAIDRVDRDAGYRGRARELAAQMRSERGAANAADEIETLLGRPAGRNS